MTDEQAAKMKKDLCDSVDALLQFSQSSPSKLEHIATGAIAMCAARFCAGVVLLVKGDQSAMSEIVQRERLWRLLSAANDLVDDEGDAADELLDDGEPFERSDLN